MFKFFKSVFSLPIKQQQINVTMLCYFIEHEIKVICSLVKHCYTPESLQEKLDIFIIHLSFCLPKYKFNKLL